ncbi:MAG: hypothetical protein MGG37_20775 [Trichodesmium sp. MAG_R01]|nr:hypothetical protein [Trichodesmium sp. MAG_R01]
MSMENKIDIHEFSTGIEVKGTATAWESGGFTGEYMNRTLDKIPQAVLDSIANREFALAEGVVRAEPAIVGRVVRRGKESWSVVAVVTRGRDDFGRGVSLYRYFLCQGDTGIETILRWMDKPLSWVFNPFDKRAIGEPHQADPIYRKINLNNFQEMLDQSPPMIFPAAESCTPLLLNEITRKLRRPNGDRSWAYKVAMLERPEYFQVIHPADAKAEMVIREVLDRRQNSSVMISGESGIKTAIKAVMNGRVKRGHIESLENALGNQGLDNNYWKSVLEKEGASQAVTENIYGDRYVRLLTLKAMLVPQFLPEFLAWLAHSKEWEIHYGTSLKLQQSMLQEAPKFTEHFPLLSEYLKWGICYTIDDLVDEPKIFKESELLLTSESGLWKEVYPSVSKELEKVLILMDEKGQNWQYLKTRYPQWSNLLEKINKFWFLQERHDPNYRSLTRLFEKVGTAKLAAIFYQIGEGSVPKSLFDKFSTNKSELRLLKKRIYRRKNLIDYIRDLDQVFYGIGGNKAPTSIMPLKEAQKSKGIVKICCDFLFEKIDMGDRMRRIFILLVFFASVSFAGYSGWFLRGILQPNGSASKRNENYQAINALIDDLTKETKNIFDQSKKNNQDDKLPKKIIASIKQNKLKKPEEILPFCIGDILEIKDFQYSDIKADNQTSLKFSDAISKYQDKKGIKNAAPGIIKRDKNTYKQLKRDIENECLYPRLSEINQDEYDKTNAAIEAIAKGLEMNIKKLVSNKSLPNDIPPIFYKDYDQEQNQNPQNINSQGIVQHCVKKELGLGSDFQYSYIRQYNKEWEKFSKAIKKYQRERGTMKDPDGVINQEKNTQKTLKENIQKKCLKPTTVESLNLKNPKPPST